MSEHRFMAVVYVAMLALGLGSLWFLGEMREWRYLLALPVILLVAWMVGRRWR